MSTFHLKIIAYDKIFYDEEAASVVLPAIDGEVQILTNHEECVVALKTGEVRIGTPKGEMIPAVCGSGFAEVTSDNQDLMKSNLLLLYLQAPAPFLNPGTGQRRTCCCRTWSHQTKV